MIWKGLTLTPDSLEFSSLVFLWRPVAEKASACSTHAHFGALLDLDDNHGFLFFQDKQKTGENIHQKVFHEAPDLSQVKSVSSVKARSVWRP